MKIEEKRRQRRLRRRAAKRERMEQRAAGNSATYQEPTLKRVCVGFGMNCPKCRLPMKRYEHPADWKPKARQSYWFAFWDCCGPCAHVQHYDVAKVTRTSDLAIRAAEKQLGERFR